MLQSPARFANALADVLRAQRECASTLLQILEDERQALAHGDLPAMDTTAANKTAALDELQKLKAQESRLLVALPFGGSDNSLEQALNWCDGSGELRAACEEVIELMVDCDRDNRRNGLLVQHRLNYVRRAIDVLHRVQAETVVYGPDGLARNVGPSRLLAEG